MAKKDLDCVSAKDLSSSPPTKRNKGIYMFSYYDVTGELLHHMSPLFLEFPYWTEPLMKDSLGQVLLH